MLRSEKEFATASPDPSADARQALVYRGAERHVTLKDPGLTNDVAYYYSVFSKGDDGAWHSEMTTTVAPKGEAHWRRAGVQDDAELQAKWAKLNFDIATLRRDQVS